MALTTAVMVGDANKWLPEVAERAAKLKVSAGNVFQSFFKHFTALFNAGRSK